MLSIRDLSKTYGSPSYRPVLKNINFDLAAGEYVAIMGESGVGKTTLLNLIAGLDTPDAGRILVGGEDMTALDDAGRTRLRGALMGFAFQSFHLLPHLTVAQNIALPLAINGVPSSQRAKLVEDILAAVKLSDRESSYPRELSGGQMQRVALARALVHGPKLLLADEPTGNLDHDSASQVLSLLRQQVSERGCSTILVTHSPIAATSASRVYILDSEGLHEG